MDRPFLPLLSYWQGSGQTMGEGGGGGEGGSLVWGEKGNIVISEKNTARHFDLTLTLT